MKTELIAAAFALATLAGAATAATMEGGSVPCPPTTELYCVAGTHLV